MDTQDDAAQQRAAALGADLPPELAILWRTPEPGRRGPRPGLTVGQIADAAIALADADGLAAVSMARVAEALGVTAMALYRYVNGKDDVLALMFDRASGPVRVDEPTGTGDLTHSVGGASAPHWRTALEAWGRAQLDLIHRHPWLVDSATTRPPVGPNQLGWLERALAALEGTPLTPAQRAEVTGRLSLHILSEGRLVAALELRRRSAGGSSGSSSGSCVEHGPAEPPGHPALHDYADLLRRVADPVRHPAITAVLTAGAFGDDPEDEYDEDLGLRLMLDGVAALIERAETVDRPDGGPRHEPDPAGRASFTVDWPS